MTRKELTSAVVALVLAFLAVQAASLVQSPPTAAVMKGEFVTDQSARLEASQPPSSPTVTVLWPAVFMPLAIAAVCYLFIRRAVW